jgi:glutathione S-transferase
MTKRKIKSQPKLKLYYFNIKGKGEPIRLFCQYAGLEFEDYRFASRQEFNELKSKLPFAQVPLLEIDDGKHRLVQSGAILRYLAKLANLYPDDPILAAKADAAFDQENDAFLGATVASYTTRFGIILDEDAKAKSYELIANEILPRHLTSIETLLKASSTGWIAGTGEPSPADFAWYSRLVNYIPQKKELSEKVKSLEEFPACRKFIEKFKSLEPIQEYYANEK